MHMGYRDTFINTTNRKLLTFSEWAGTTMFAQTMDQMNSTLLNYFSPSWVKFEKYSDSVTGKKIACLGYFLSID